MLALFVSKYLYIFNPNKIRMANIDLKRLSHEIKMDYSGTVWIVWKRRWTPEFKFTYIPLQGYCKRSKRLSISNTKYPMANFPKGNAILFQVVPANSHKVFYALSSCYVREGFM